jgi:hypothetical protein
MKDEKNTTGAESCERSSHGEAAGNTRWRAWAGRRRSYSVSYGVSRWTPCPVNWELKSTDWTNGSEKRSMALILP